MLNENTWGKIIDEYTDADAQDDGILIDVSDLNANFNGRVVNRITVGAALATGLREMQQATAKHNLQMIADRASFDGDGADAWGIVAPDARFGNEKLWLVPNEVKGITILLPSEY